MRPAGMSDNEEDEYDVSIHTDMVIPNNKHLYKKSALERIIEATQNNNIEEIKLLLKTEISTDNLSSVFHKILCTASSYGFVDICKYVIENGININFHNANFITPLMLVCGSNYKISSEEELVECVNLFINSGANVNNKDVHGLTPLMYACKEGYTKVAKILLSHGALIHQQDNNDWTPLFHAVYYGKLEMVKLLLEYGAEINIRDDQNRTLHRIAEEKNYTDIMELVKPEYSNDLDQDYGLIYSGGFTTKEMISDMRAGFQSTMFKFLLSVELQDLYPQFKDHDISLEQFLRLSHENLTNIGIRFSYQRNIILSSLKDLHLLRWSNGYIKIPQKDEDVDLKEILLILANTIHQLHIIRGTLGYIRTNSPFDLSTNKESFNLINLLAKHLQGIIYYIGRLQQISDKVSKFDNSRLPDLIEPKKTSWGTFVGVAILGLGGIITLTLSQRMFTSYDFISICAKK